MSFAMNKNFSRAHSSTNILPEQIPTASLFIDSFEHRITLKISQRISIILESLSHLCQILDDHSLSEIKIEQIEQGTVECILWNDDRSYSIAIDQNKHLILFRQAIRELVYEFLEFAQEILVLHDKNKDINMMIQKILKYLILLNNYRTKRQLAYNSFCQNYTGDDGLLVLINVDKQQFHQLRLIALYLRQFFVKLIRFTSSKVTVLE